MKLKRHCKPDWRPFYLHVLQISLGSTLALANASAQEPLPFDEPSKRSTKSDEFEPPTSIKLEANSKRPDAIQALMPSIVTVTRVEPAGGDTDKKPLSHNGVVVDARGYIVIPLLPGPAKLFVVRLSNQQEVMGELVLTDESLKVGLLKIEQSLPIKAVSLDKGRSARNDGRVLLVSSSTKSELRSGRIISTTFSFGDETSTKLIQADIACPLSEFGSLMVSEASEPIGLVLTSRSDTQPMSIVVPLDAIQTALQAAIDKPKDVPLIRLPSFSPDIDLHKPVSITLQPVSPHAKSLVELFADRGAKILEYEEGKRMKIEAPPQVLELLSNLLALVSSEESKDSDLQKNAEASKNLKLDLQPATPLVKSLVELFAKHGAKVLEYKEGQRLQIEAPAKTMEHLRKLLEIVSHDSQLISVREETLEGAPKPANQQDEVQKPSNVTVEKVEQADSAAPPKPLSYILDGAADSREVTRIFHLQSSDAASMFDVVKTLFQGKVRRISADQRTNSLIVVAMPLVSDEVEAILLKLDTTHSRQRPTEAKVTSLPDTKAAKELVERLEAQESAAASAANEIRRLQANGNSVAAIDPHRAQLNTHLQSAFELKMQLEELQVKELQARLSRLERQIGQRKELREKIITRRAAELIAGESLRWNTSATAEPFSTNAVNVAKEATVPSSKPGRGVRELPTSDEKYENGNTRAPLLISEQQKLRWRSGLVEIHVERSNQQAEINGGAIVSSNGLIVSQLSSRPGNAQFLARFDDGSLFPLQIVENPGSNLYVFQLPPNTPINHYFKLSGESLNPSDEVYVFGRKTGSTEHKLSTFTAQVVMKDRRIARHDLFELSLWQLSMPDDYGTAESWPALNAKGELLGITVRDTSDLLLVLPIEELQKMFPKSLGGALNSSNALLRESPSTSVPQTHPSSEVSGLLKKLQGKWIIEKAVSELSNNTSEEQIAQSGEVIVDGTLFTLPFTEGDKRAEVPMLMEIQSPSNPQCVKVSFDPNGIGATALGIIDCDSDRLRLCIGQAVGKGETPNESSRPKVFVPGSHVLYLECQRKPTELPTSPIGSRSPISPDPGVEGIAAGLDTSAAAIKNISVITDYKKRHVYGLPFDAAIELTLVTKTIVDREGRLRVQTTGQQINIEPDGKSARAYNGIWETVFRDGEARGLTWYESNPPTASIDNTPSLHGIHPSEFTTHFQSKPVSEILRSSAAEVAERTMWDDRPVTIVQTLPVQNANDARRYRFWIDQERNVVVRRAIAIRFAEGQPWQEYARIENHDYQQVAPGIWLPSKVKYESLEVTPELAPAKLSWSYEGTNRDWKVNSELPADTFELAFPAGAVVNDHRGPGIAAYSADAEMKSLQESDLVMFQGTWCFDVLQSSAWPKPIGLPTDSSGRKSEQRWIINGDRITWNSPDGEQIDVSFTIDPSKNPKQIDFTFLSGPQKGMKSVGIYEPQKGNANYLWLCMTNPGTNVPRPTEVGYSSEKQQSMIGIHPVEKENTAKTK